MGKGRINNLDSSRDDANAHYRRLEQVVKSIENSKTYYDVLGVRQDAKRAEIQKAYQRLITVLNPLLHKTTASLSGHAQRRVDNAFQLVTVAHTILSNYSRRIEYDESIGVKAGLQEQQKLAHDSNGDSQKVNSRALPKAQQRSSAAQAQRHESAQSPVGNDSVVNSRKSERLKLALPVQVSGYERASGEWSEMTRTLDVSRTGCKITLRHRMRNNMIVRVSLALPAELRANSGIGGNYDVYALARRVDAPREGCRVVALEFLGPEPPQAFREKPWRTFRTMWTGAERRRRPRFEKCELVAIQYLDEAMQPIRYDDAVTENVSTRGMRIRLSSPAPEFDMIKVIRAPEKREMLCVASDRYFAEDGFERICLRFIGDVQAAAAAEHRTEQAPALGKKILVADDDPPLRKVLGRILTDAGYDVLFAEDGQAAVEKAAAEKPDLVIVDALMPKMHGFLACKTIKEMDSPPKVILLTAVYTKKNYKWEARGQYGADEFLTKPFELSALLACIDKQLANQRP